MAVTRQETMYCYQITDFTPMTNNVKNPIKIPKPISKFKIYVLLRKVYPNRYKSRAETQEFHHLRSGTHAIRSRRHKCVLNLTHFQSEYHFGSVL